MSPFKPGVKVKICGITTLEDGLMAARAGADLLGLNFFPKSPRYLTPDAARDLAEGLRAELGAGCPALVGLFVNEVVGKAGRARWKGARPVSRGIARNPVDHPNGGRTNGGKHWATPWGKPTKGKKTRNNKSTQKLIVRSRHDRKKSQ